jgi:nucleotide-binding universal stress UspA family protein
MTNKVLVAVDASQASSKVLTYLVDTFHNPSAIQVRLFHVLPPIPPELREHGGSEDPDKEEILGENLREAQARWIEEAMNRARAFVESAKAVLLEGGFSAQLISTEYSPSVLPSEVVRDIIQAATTWQCDTIAVGRKCCSKFADLTYHHVGEELVEKGQGFTIWVVE